MAPTGSAHLSYTMAALTAAGGVMGYVKKRSVPSAAAGIGFGVLYAAGGSLITGGNAQAGHDLSLAASLVLSGVMGARAARTRKFMPAGLLTLLGSVSAAYHLHKSLQWRQLL